MGTAFLHGNGGSIVEVATGSIGDKNRKVNCGFQPDFIYLTLGEFYMGEKDVTGVDFIAAGTDAVCCALWTSKNGNDVVSISLKRTETGFNVTDFTMYSVDAYGNWVEDSGSGSITYRAVKYAD